MCEIRDDRARGKTIKYRYLSSQKLSNYLIEKILAAYTARVSAADFLTVTPKGRLSRNTVYAIYDLVRRRLLEIGYYTQPEDYYAFWTGDPERRSIFEFSEAAARIVAQADRLKGASVDSARYILAEIIFFAEHPGLSPQAFLGDIKLAIKITGPLNQPPQNVDLWHARSYILEIDRQISDLRRNRHTAVKKLAVSQIETLEAVRSQALARLRRNLRERSLRIRNILQNTDVS